MKFFWIGLGIVFLIVLLVFGTIRGGRKHKKIAEDAFKDRTSLEPKEFHRAHFAKNGIPLEFIEKFLHAFSDEYDLDLSRLSPEDDFRNSLLFLDDVDSLGLEELRLRLEEEFEVSIPESEAAEAFTTVSNLITTIWKKTQQS